MSSAFSYEQDMARDAASKIVAHHIKARLMQTGCKLRRGDPESTADKLIRPWSRASVIAFYILAKENRTLSATALAGRTNGSAKALASWWHRLKRYYVLALPHDTIGKTVKVYVFRHGSEMFHGADGVKLQLNTSMLDWSVSRWIFDSTLERNVTERKNQEGALAAQEADETRTEEQRTEARRRMNEEMSRPDIEESPQEKLFGSE
jgi:hypothetical protein